MYRYILILFISQSFIFSQCTPIEVSTYISEKDGWMFPYSTFYWGMSDALYELTTTNQPCYELLENNEECIQNCMYLVEEEADYYLGRIGCIYYNCTDGNALIQNYEEYQETPFHLYGQYYCSEETIWSEELDVCLSGVCNGDLNGDEVKNITDIVQLVNQVLNEEGCE